MDLEFDFDKIKKIPRFLAQKAFWTTLVLIFITALVALFLGYKYVYLVKQSSPQTSDLIHLNQSRLQNVLEQLEQRESEFEEVTTPSYDLFEVD